MPSPTQRGGGRGRRRMMNDINVVPYIDVMLVLLIIFMASAPLVNPAVVELPSVGKSSQPPAKPLEVIIKADASMSVRDRNSGQSDATPVDHDELVAFLKQKQSATPDQPVVISADKNVKYDSVLKVMDELQKSDIKRIGLTVRPSR